MYTLNKIVGCFISPAGFSIALVSAAVLARILSKRRLSVAAALLALANFWVWSMPWMTKWMGAALEAEFLVDGRVSTVESLPQADVIELHGGTMGVATNVSSYAEMWSGADRVWHAARIWRDQVKRRMEKGECANVKILVTSGSTDLSTGPLLEDLGVPKEAIIYDFGPRNTEEEARCVATNGTKRVLVVTSAWHMKRTMLMYKKYAPNLEAIPAACDFENTLGADKIGGWTSLLPAPEAFMGNSVAFREWLGYFGYKWFR